MTKSVIMLVIIFLLLSNCTVSSDLEWTPIGSASIPIPSYISDFSKTMRIHPSTPNRLYYSVDGRNEIAIIDLKNQKIDSIAHFPVEEDGVISGMIQGFSFDDQDKLILSSQYFPTTVYRVNTMDSIQVLFEMLDPIENQSSARKYFYTSCILYNDYVQIDNKILIPVNFFEDDMNKIFDSPALYYYDSENQKFGSTKFLFPEDISLDSYATVPMLLKAKDEQVLSFISSNKIFRFRNLTEYIEIQLRSKYEDDNLSSLPKYDNRFVNYAKSFGYYGILYDKYRDVYYRLVKHSHPEALKQTEKESKYYSNIFSIMILDRDFNILDERLLKDSEKYVFSNMFVGPEGLYISRNNPYHADYDENSLDFDIFRFE